MYRVFDVQYVRKLWVGAIAFLFAMTVGAEKASLVSGKGIDINILSTTSKRIILTGQLSETDFIGTIKNRNKYSISSVGVEVHVMDCSRDRKDCSYAGSGIMWIDTKLNPKRYAQFKQTVRYDWPIKLNGKPIYNLNIIGVIQ